MLLLALGLTGCSTTSVRKTAPENLPPSWDSDLGPVHEIEPSTVFTNAPSVTKTNAAAPQTAVVVRPKTAPQTIAETGMVPLSRWAAQNGYPISRVLPLAPTVAYVIKTPSGNFTVRGNSLSAYWGRIEVRLGFRPQQVSDQLFVHALDLKKIIEPLAHGTSVATPTDRLVVIDPGHGGSQSGTRNVITGRYEKDYTLDWARRLGPLLEQSRWRVAYTRTSDVTLSLADRVAFAESQHAHLFISLHFNATGDTSSGPAGLETYCVTPMGRPSTITRGYEDDSRLTFPNNRFDAENLRYAMRLHSAILQVNGQLDRGVRHARFLDVLTAQNRPAVLIEGGYLSNPTEAKRVADPAYRQKLAEAVAKALE